MNSICLRKPGLELLEERRLLAVFSGGFALSDGALPAPASGEAPSTVVTTLKDVVDPDDGLVSLREAVLYAKELGTPVSFGVTGVCSLNSPIEITSDIEINAYWVILTQSGEGEYPAFTITGSRFSMTGGSVNGFADSGMKISGSTAELNNLSFNNCSSPENGGALTASQTSLVLNGVSFYYNTAGSSGGAVYFDGGGESLTVSNGYIVGNRAAGQEGCGGGIAFFGGGDFRMSGTQVSANRAEGNTGAGGGIYADGVFRADMLMVQGNAAVNPNGVSCGGGICAANGSAVISQSLIAGNYADSGAGIASCGDLTLYNATVAGNASLEGGTGGVFAAKDARLYNTIAALNNGGNTNVSEESCSFSVIGGDPLFAEFVPYETADWNEYQADYWNLRLREDSPAVDAGNNGFALESDGGTPLEWDFDILPRFNRTVDAGCYENQTVIVNTAEDVVAEDDFLSLREAIELANNAWVTVQIRFAESVQNETFYLESPLELCGPADIDGRGTVVIDGKGTSGLFVISSGQAALTGLVFSNGSASAGGLICGSDAELTISDCVFTAGSASENGGAIYLYDSLVSITGSAFRGNSAGGNGGGIYSVDSFLAVSDSVFTENRASESGGAAAVEGTYSDWRVSSFNNADIRENNARSGGGIAVLGKAAVSLNSSSLLENSALVSGGGLFNEGTLHCDCAFVAGNDAAESGGGIENAGTAVFANTIIAGNFAEEGGAVHNTGTLTCYNTTISGNASVSGPALKNGASASIYNTILALNSGGDADVLDNRTSSIVGENPAFQAFLPYDAADWEPGLYLGWNFALTEISAAVDSGDNEYALSSQGWAAWNDQAGNRRIVNEIVDIGALELQKVPETPSIESVQSAGANRHRVSWGRTPDAVSWTVAWSSDGVTWNTAETGETQLLISDLDYGAVVTYRVAAHGADGTVSEWSEAAVQRVCPADINGDGSIDTIDRALMAAAWLTDSADENWDPRCDIDGDGTVSETDRLWLIRNWLKDAEDGDIVYPY